jgi:endonuclease III
VTKEEKVLEIIKRLKKVYSHAKIALDFTTPLELLVATIMSAQTLDKLVNVVTPALFKKYKTAKDYADAPVAEIDEMIKRVNFHANKARNIKAAAQIIVEKHGGKLPDTMEELDALPGVARKTANVVLSNAFGKSEVISRKKANVVLSNAFGKAEGIVIDTHMIRMSNKLGLTTQKDPVKIEEDLMKIVPKEYWIDFAHMLILHGRGECPARPHDCSHCSLGDLCPDK